MGKNHIISKAGVYASLLGVMVMSNQVSAEQVDFTASTHINRGTCEISSGAAGITLDFGEVTPLVAMAGTLVKEKSFKLNNCVAVNNLTISLNSDNTTTLTGTWAGKWVVPATGGATGVAFKTEVKNGGEAKYYPLPADNTPPNTGTEKYTPEYSIYIKGTLIPTVASIAQMSGGSLASTAVLNIIYQ
ncbi:hypothetical protein CYR55_05145 [Chimaeribacter californicus]|uniref:Fimbrial-type adhesion domain-containing protein n=1 Tax=Chimaeribacter californicus TaxID=2060067 RepID=A0A2N5EDQ4_9GAMM|nr:hypothetical protein [Chimaeribacter californicus]PLR40669.1 hypothetical protein CYR55_05145 [Chimaeribacter californicus]